MAIPRFLRDYPPSQPADGSGFWLPFRGNNLLTQTTATGLALLSGDSALLASFHPSEALYIGTLDARPVFACEVDSETTLPDGWEAVGLRGLYGRLLDEEEYDLAGYAAQLLYWRHSSGFCAVCGNPTEQVNGDWGKRCTVCHHTSYPHVNPAILVLIHDGGDHVLLTHKPGWTTTYSIIAGFVEPGESLEGCVAREAREEVGLEIRDIQYIGNQPWPFPHQLMVGFIAQYESGTITIEPKELDDARWFHVDELPDLPSPLSLSRQLINRWAASRKQG